MNQALRQNTMGSHPFHSADVDSTWANIEKAKELIDWKPTVNLDDGLKNTVEWYMKNKNWLSKLDFHDK